MLANTLSHTLAASAIYLVTVLALFEGLFCQGSRINNQPNYFTPVDILAPVKSCQLKLMVSPRYFPTLALRMIRQLSEFGTPYESLFQISTLRVHNYARRHRDHCSVRIVFSPSLHIQLWAAGSEDDHSVSRINRETEIVIFMAQFSPGQRVSIKRHEWLCQQPLNIILLLYEQVTQESLWISQKIIFQRCKDGQLFCSSPDDFLLGNVVSQKPVESYGDALSHFRKIRNNFHGTTVYYYKAQMNYKLGDTAPYHELEGFRLSHKHLAFADLQVPIMLAEEFNFTFSAYRDHVIGDIGDGSNLGALYCRIGAFTHGDGFASSDDVEGLALRLFFEGFSYFNGFYTDDDGDDLSPIPFKLKTLMLPADRVIWTLVVVTIVLISIVTAVKLCAKDWVGVALSVTLPLSGQTCLFGNKAETELKVWYSAWILLTFLLGTEYTNVVQSLTTVPKRTPGKLTFRELMEKNFTIGDISQTDYNRLWGGRVFPTAFSDWRIHSRSGLFQLEE